MNQTPTNAHYNNQSVIARMKEILHFVQNRLRNLIKHVEIATLYSIACNDNQVGLMNQAPTKIQNPLQTLKIAILTSAIILFAKNYY